MPRPSLNFRPAAALLAALTLALTACAPGTADEAPAETTPVVVSEAEPGAFPVSIDHAFGTFELDETPERVVTIGWATEDISAALGVIPVAVPSSWAGDEDGFVPWFRDAVESAGAPLPETLTDLSGGEIDFEQILSLRPDAIIAPFSGITDTQYERLQGIAPTVAYPEKPWYLDWQDHTELVGKALGRPARAAELVADTQAAIAERGAEHPEFNGATFVYSTGVGEGTTDVGFYAPTTSLIGIIQDLGLTLSPEVVAEAKRFPDEIYFGVSLEEIDTVTADVYLGLVNNQDEVDASLAHTLFRNWQPITNDHAVWLTDREVSQAVAAPSVLSVPWVLDRFVPELADALKK